MDVFAQIGEDMKLLRRDTGLRRIEGSLSGIASGIVNFRSRRGVNTITFVNVKVTAAGDVDLHTSVDTLLTGWLPVGVDVQDRVNVGNSAIRRVMLTSQGLLRVYGLTTTDTINGSFRWDQDKPWPVTYPGVVA